MKQVVWAIGVLITIFVNDVQAFSRQQLHVVGSSSVYPFAIAVAEAFGRKTHLKIPLVESTGTGVGFRLFCAGVGETYPDIATASRPMTNAERQESMQHGVQDIAEIKIGYDGIVLANARTGPLLSVTRHHLFLALAKEILVEGKLTPNPYKTWKNIDSSLPDIPLVILGPAPSSGTYDVLMNLLMDHHTLREDGVYQEMGDNENLLLQKLLLNPNAFGFFSFSFLNQNMDRLKAAAIEGYDPSLESIKAGHYPLSRPLYLYVKKDHLYHVPGIQEYVAEFLNDMAMGDYSYLTAKGLIPLSPQELKLMQTLVESFGNQEAHG
jgi:phosphate transport system substrate-binding protein